ncbi:uncharacterized protein LOC111347019 isoform X3 [Stylophora pistillata]|uniref:uncharacterized protein LOC111347019 isoform X3 n=1 Tax=Stylophora pistillata TaxID=50429 RepID=UPI000C048A12|nr:uncharacterized protein LOC111347019 isoform X3 [Stylophora pistillata]
MEVVTYPTPEDTQAFAFEKGDAEEVINPENSGLKRPVKGSFSLFFSILLIFYQKKLQTKEYSRDKGTQIGPIKISDFLIFWILPYLLNFTHRKVNDITNHHKRISEEKGEPMFKCQIIQKSAGDIMESAFNFSNTPPPISGFLMRKFEKYYGKACAIKYNLPQRPKGTPIILVPSSYEVTDMPVVLEDLGSSWREIGDITLVDQFIEKFVESGEIQRDFFCSFEHVEKRFCVDYGIILPDLQTFDELIGQVESQDSSIFQEVKEQGQDSPSPRLGLIKHPEKSQSVCFSYLPGKDPHSVEKIFRLVSSNRLNCFTLVLLYGSAFHWEDANCKLLSLYPVKGCRKCVFQDDEMVPEKSLKQFESVVGKFSRLDFPETYLSLQREIQRDGAVREMRRVLSEETAFNLSNPEFVHGEPVEVFYATVKDQVKLKNYVINLEMKGCCVRRVANLDGSLLSSFFRKRRKVGVVTAINNVFRPSGSLYADLQKASRRKNDLFPLRKLERAARSVIVHFVRAIVVAGLPEVYPPTPGNGVEDDDIEDDKGSSSNEEQVMSDIASGLNPSWESQITSASNYSPGGDQAIADFYTSQQPSTSGSRNSQCRVSDHDALVDLFFWGTLKR